VRIATFDFPESNLLAQLYGRALAAAGYRVGVVASLGTRELVEPALEQGLVDFVPEYLGSALQFISLGRAQNTPDSALAHRELAAALAPKGVTLLSSAPAQDRNALVVRADTAAQDRLRKISDLAPVAHGLVIGGPPECTDRPLCYQGLQRVYDLTFKGQFVPLDTAGTYTVSALKNGSIDVAVLFTTDGRIGVNRFVVLDDDRRLQPAENVTPVVRRQILQAYGGRFADVVDAVSHELSTEDLAAMNLDVSVRGKPAAEVASVWLKEHGFGH